MDTATLSTTARALGSALEPVIGQVYFSPECHANYVALGFDPSPGVANGVAYAGSHRREGSVLAGGMNHTRPSTIRISHP